MTDQIPTSRGLSLDSAPDSSFQTHVSYWLHRWPSGWTRLPCRTLFTGRPDHIPNGPQNTLRCVHTFPGGRFPDAPPQPRPLGAACLGGDLLPNLLHWTSCQRPVTAPDGAVHLPGDLPQQGPVFHGSTHFCHSLQHTHQLPVDTHSAAHPRVSSSPHLLLPGQSGCSAGTAWRWVTRVPHSPSTATAVNSRSSRISFPGPCLWAPGPSLSTLLFAEF